MDNAKGPQSFSTKKKTIGQVKYTEAGGILEFEVYTNPGEKFSFKLVRTNYDDKFGRIFFKGEIKYEDRRGPVVVQRSGIAKLVDRNN